MAWIVTERVEKFVSRRTLLPVEQVDTGWGLVTVEGSYPDIHVFDTETQARDWAAICEAESPIGDWYDGVIVYVSVTVEPAMVFDRRRKRED